MKRFHVHLAVDDPRVNFAMSQRGAAPGLDHLGIQVESEAELAEIWRATTHAGCQLCG